MDWKRRITILYACRQCRALFPPIMLNSHVSIIVRPQSLNQLWQYTKQEISEGPICLASDTSETDKSHLISAGVFPATSFCAEKPWQNPDKLQRCHRQSIPPPILLVLQSQGQVQSPLSATKTSFRKQVACLKELRPL